MMNEDQQVMIGALLSGTMTACMFALFILDLELFWTAFWILILLLSGFLLISFVLFLAFFYDKEETQFEPEEELEIDKGQTWG